MEMFVYILIVADHHPRIKKGVAIVILNCARSILSSMNGALHVIIFNEVRSRFSFFALTLRKRRTKGQLTIINESLFVVQTDNMTRTKFEYHSFQHLKTF